MLKVIIDSTSKDGRRWHLVFLKWIKINSLNIVMGLSTICLPTSLYTSVYTLSTTISFVIILLSPIFKVGALREKGMDTKYNTTRTQ